jgi:hypothetical protein
LKGGVEGTLSGKDWLQYLHVDFNPDQDSGVCLSMHQPWASLLVLGIKRFEGRGWSTLHRGRLWIASTAQEVSSAR